MESKNVFSHVIYEVIDSETQKYSSTAVRGGDRGSAVHSTTTFHSDQDVWVKDIATGKERKFEFENFNISVRPGHKLACVWHSATNELEAVVNFATERRVLGINKLSERNLCNWIRVLFCSLLSGVMFLIPYLGALMCFILFMVGFTPVCDLKTKLIGGYRIGLLIAALAYLWIGKEIIDHVRHIDNPLQFMRNVFIFNFFLTFIGCVVANNYVKNGRKQLTEYLGTINF
ncbi:MAG: hypothetical protein EOO53_14305 [Gammaproteobacteria bacterium]|nr:MAG: hypothetical protein EOO53_14305 [Gammaproteobacteria bacterium]